MNVQDAEGNRRSGSAGLSIKRKLQGEATNHTLFSLLNKYEQTYAHRILGVVVRVNAGYVCTGSTHII